MSTQLQIEILDPTADDQELDELTESLRQDLLELDVDSVSRPTLGPGPEGSKGLDQDKLADYLRSHTFKTIVGDVKFGANGEWAEPRVLEVQFRGIKANDVEQFKDASTEVILWPPELKTGDVVYPYSDAKK